MVSAAARESAPPGPTRSIYSSSFLSHALHADPASPPAPQTPRCAARIHLGRPAGAAPPPPADGGAAPGADADEVDVDARPSDAINLAVRFGAPMFVAKRIVDVAATPPLEPFGLPGGGPVAGASAAPAAPVESNAEIVRSVREALSSYDDPTVMYQLQKELAIKEERFEDARWVGAGARGVWGRVVVVVHAL